MAAARALRCVLVAAAFAPAALLADSGTGTWPLSDGGMSATYLAQLVVTLLFVIVAIVVLGFLLRRVPGVRSPFGAEFRVLAGISVGARERMLLVQVGEKQLVIGVAPGRVQTLHVLDEPVVFSDGRRAPGQTQESPFAKRLRALMQRSPGT